MTTNFTVKLVNKLKQKKVVCESTKQQGLDLKWLSSHHPPLLMTIFSVGP